MRALILTMSLAVSCASASPPSAGGSAGNAVKKSVEGETCSKSEDCAGELRCVDSKCAQPATSPADAGSKAADSAGQGDAGGADTGAKCSAKPKCQSEATILGCSLADGAWTGPLQSFQCKDICASGKATGCGYNKAADGDTCWCLPAGCAVQSECLSDLSLSWCTEGGKMQTLACSEVCKATNLESWGCEFKKENGYDVCICITATCKAILAGCAVTKNYCTASCYDKHQRDGNSAKLNSCTNACLNGLFDCQLKAYSNKFACG